MRLEFFVDGFDFVANPRGGSYMFQKGKDYLTVSVAIRHSRPEIPFIIYHDYCFDRNRRALSIPEFELGEASVAECGECPQRIECLLAGHRVKCLLVTGVCRKCGAHVYIRLKIR